MASAEVFTLEASALPHGARVLALRGEEALSRPYRFEVFLLVDRAASLDFDMDAALGQRATLRVHRGDGDVRQTHHGVLEVVELLHELPGDAVYRVELAPKLTGLARSHHNRVYVGQSVPDILEDVFTRAGLRADEDFVFRLERSYRPLDHVCQYRESNLAFASRWMEREGLYYFFEQGEGSERLVITDARAFHEPLGRAPVRFVAGSTHGGTSAVEGIGAFTARRAALPGAVRLRDYDYLHPTLDVSGAHPVTPGAAGELHYHGDNFTTPADGRRLAALRAEEQLAGRAVYHGEGRVFELRTGYLFELDEHPRPAFNARYLVTALRFEGSNVAGSPELRAILRVERDDPWHVRVEAIPAAVQYRAPRVTPAPRIYGIETAVVCGPAASDYAQIDEHGRYKVKVHFDEGTARQGRASMWVRMLQPHGGSPEGFHFPLRKDTEVLLVFLGGDPDRPVITGVVPNALTPSPVTQQNATYNVIHTGGDNRIELQDSAGAQHIDIASPTQNTHLHLGATGQRTHNFALSTDGDGLVHTGANLDVTVDGAKAEHVVGDVTEAYDSNQSLTVGVNLDERYGANNTIRVGGDQTLTVQGDRAVTVMADQSVQVMGDHRVSVLGNQDVQVAGDEGYRVLGNRTVVVGANRTTAVGGNETTTIAGNHTLHITGSHNVTVDSDHKFEFLGHEVTVSSANSTEIVYGLKNNAFFGVTNDLFVGAKTSVCGAIAQDSFVGGRISNFVGISADTFLGVKLEASAALRLSAQASIYLEATASLKLGEAAVKFEMEGVHIRRVGPEINCVAILIIA